jgi:ubiquitin C-terminal hydrolase
VKLGPSDSSAASQQVLIEVLPPVLVIHLKRFLYDPAAGGVIKIDKPVQFTPELEIPLGASFSFVPLPVPAEVKYTC